MRAPFIVWFRQDLRLDDNPALAAAAARGPVVALYVLDDEGPGAFAPGGASRWWLHHSLAALGQALADRGGRLVLRRGRADEIVPALAAEIGAAGAFWNRCYEPFAVARDTAIKAALTAAGRTVQSFNASLLFEPWTIVNRAGEPFRVFTPFWRACLAAEAPPRPQPAPEQVPAPNLAIASDDLAGWTLTPSAPDWAGGLRATWQPGEAGAAARLSAFLEDAAGRYAADRNRPDLAGTSRLSPHLHWGEISPRAIWHSAAARGAAQPRASSGLEKFLSEIGWREFSHHLLFHNPQLPHASLRPEFAGFPWREDAAAFRAWSRGRTGYPIVDAGMRQLWQEGWMHNRVRMIAASFLVKDLLVPWQQGAAWFWDTLVDADLANNAASWQWVAGCGADAAPYFRVFNPVLQGEKFDPAGDYVRRYVPELAGLPAAAIHRPLAADSAVLARAGVVLGRSYPTPLVDHHAARARALAAFARIKSTAA